MSGANHSKLLSLGVNDEEKSLITDDFRPEVWLTSTKKNMIRVRLILFNSFLIDLATRHSA